MFNIPPAFESWRTTGPKGEPTRLVVLEFPSMEKARAFYNSAEYAPLLKIRLAATESQAILVDGT